MRAGSDFMLDVIKSTRLRVRGRQSRVQLPQPARINHQLRRKPQPGAFDLPSRRGFRRDRRTDTPRSKASPWLTTCTARWGCSTRPWRFTAPTATACLSSSLSGNDSDMTNRSARTDMNHSAQDVAHLVRDFTKWDDAPVSLNDFAESAVRGYKIAMTPPYGPVVLAVDKYLQERPIPEGMKLRIPKLAPTTPPEGDPEAVAETAKLLVNAEFPVILAERAARTEAGLKYMVELAELLQAAVVDSIQRMNFPTRHPLNQDARVVSDADVILALEYPLLWSAVNGADPDSPAPGRSPGRSRLKPGAKIVTISSLDLFSRSNYQDLGRYQEADLSIGADAEETLPALIEQVKRLITPDRKTGV